MGFFKKLKDRLFSLNINDEETKIKKNKKQINDSQNEKISNVAQSRKS